MSGIFNVFVNEGVLDYEAPIILLIGSNVTKLLGLRISTSSHLTSNGTMQVKLCKLTGEGDAGAMGAILKPLNGTDTSDTFVYSGGSTPSVDENLDLWWMPGYSALYEHDYPDDAQFEFQPGEYVAIAISGDLDDSAIAVSMVLEEA